MANTLRSIRQRRKMTGMGFLGYEVASFDRIPFTVPYFRDMCRQRNKEFRAWLKARKLVSQWMRHIKIRYEQKGWMKGKAPDPFKMLRHFEDDYKARFPEYDSPWQKRPKVRRDFMARINRTIAKQRGMA